MTTKVPTNVLLNLLVSDSNLTYINKLYVGVVINYRNSVLLLRRKRPDSIEVLYDLPHTKVEKGENLLQVLKNELKRQTNLDLASVDEYLGHFDVRFKLGLWNRQYNFKINIYDFSVFKLNDDYESFAWVKDENIGNYLTIPQVNEIIFKEFESGWLETAKADNMRVILIGAVIKNNKNEILMLRRNPKNEIMGGLFEIPTGLLQPNFSILEALKKQLKNKTNLDLCFVGNYLGYFDYVCDRGNDVRQFNFEVSVVDIFTALNISDMHDGIYWISKEEIKRYEDTDPIKHILLNGL